MRIQETPENPSGALMMKRSQRIKYIVLDTLHEYPPSRGDDMLLWLHIVRKHYWQVSRVSTRDKGLSISCAKFADFFMLPSFETCRRRRQEWQEIEKHKIERGEIASSDILPTERVIRKRARLESAYRNDLGKGQLAVSDFVMRD
jgi:hypothetical protein